MGDGGIIIEQHTITTIESRKKELIVGIFILLKMVPTQIIEDAIRQILSQNEMFNSKAIQKEMESNHKTVLSDSSITKI